MSARERWTVYPLLFMTLGIAMRDKVIPPERLGNPAMQLRAGEVVAPRIRCNALQIANQEGRPVVIAGADTGAQAGLIETFNQAGVPQVRLFSNETGGVVNTIVRNGRGALVLGDTGMNMGLFAKLPELSALIPLTLPWRVEVKPNAAQPGKDAGGDKPKSGD